VHRSILSSEMPSLPALQDNNAADLVFDPAGASGVRALETYRDVAALMIDQLETDWPRAAAIMERLAHYVTGHLRTGRDDVVPSRPLVYTIFDMGLCGYYEARNSADDLRFAAFIRAVLAEAAGRMGGIVLAAGTRRWCPAGGVPLSWWLEDVDSRSVQVHQRRSGADISAALSAFILCDADRRILRRAA